MKRPKHGNKNAHSCVQMYSAQLPRRSRSRTPAPRPGGDRTPPRDGAKCMGQCKCKDVGERDRHVYCLGCGGGVLQMMWLTVAICQNPPLPPSPPPPLCPLPIKRKYSYQVCFDERTRSVDLSCRFGSVSARL